ncbi:MAG: metal ABC transporter permease [Sulfolobales archaeon]|nr:metal ABC transporter permease [Sulfolobales archaeon]
MRLSSIMISLIPLLTASYIIMGYRVQWLISMYLIGLTYGFASALVSARRLYFLAEAAPHSALLAVAMSIALSTVADFNELAAATLIGLALVCSICYFIHRGVDQDIATAIYVSATASLSVISMYFVMTRAARVLEIASLLIGDPLLMTHRELLYLSLIAAVVVALSALTYRGNVVIGVDSEYSKLIGMKVWLYDLTAFTVIGLTSIGLLRAVGYILEHILLLVPAAIATNSHSSSEALKLAVSSSVFASVAGLLTSITVNVAPSGTIGLTLLLIYILSSIMRSGRGLGFAKS